jgi:hypothetical protein
MAKAIKSSKQQTKSQPSKTASGQFDFSFFDSKKANYVFLGLIVLAIILFFKDGILGGKIFASPDNLSPNSFRTFLNDAKSSGIFPLWVPYIFMGMPSLASLTSALPALHNIFSFIWDSILSAFSGENLFLLTIPYYFLFAISLYFYINYKFKNNFIALYCALTGVFATGIIQLIIVGHHTKMMTFAFFPLIMLIIDRLIEQENKNIFKLLISLALLTILIYIQLHFHHIQMLYYSYMMIGIYIGYNVIYRLIKKIEIKNVLTAISIFIIAAVIALAMDADILFSVKEYKTFSKRGEASIITKNDPSKKDVQPLDYDYATSWSFSPGEVLTFIVPSYYGFGSVEVDGKRDNFYWGQMPFTDSPVYFGIITFFLALIGIIFNFRKNSFVQALTVIVVLFLFISFGKNFSLIFDLIYKYFPLYSSFRAPVMIHYYMDLAFVVLAGFGLHSIITAVKDKKYQDLLKKISYAVMGISVFMFLISVVGCESSYKDSVMNGPMVSQYKSQGINPQQISQYFAPRAKTAYDNMVNDLRLHGFLLLLVGLIIYLYSAGKIRLVPFLSLLILFGVFDIANLSYRTLHWDSKSQLNDYFKETDVSKFILNKDPDTYTYRVVELNKGKIVTSNNLAYYRLHAFNGYQGAKLRIYEDAIDVAGNSNPLLLGLANVKYVMTDKESPIKDTVNFTELFKGSNIIYENKRVQPRAFFVDEYKVDNGMNILNEIKDGKFEAGKIAFFEQDISKKIDKPDSIASAKIVKFDIHNIEYDVNATGNNLLVLSEIYYPAGWKAFIDGNETEVYKTDYFLRSVIVPAGKHKVEMKFHPESYYKGKQISTIANIFVVLVLIVGTGGYFLRKRKIQKEAKV